MIEQWKPITDWEDRYEISNCGNVRSKLTGRNLAFDLNHRGYHRISFYQSRRKARHYVHRLVYEHFVSKIPYAMQVNHIDGNKKNNTVNNLEIVTGSDNLKHAYRTGLMVRTGVAAPCSEGGKGKLSPNDLVVIRAIPPHIIDREIASRFGVVRSTISRVRRPKSTYQDT